MRSWLGALVLLISSLLSSNVIGDDGHHHAGGQQESRYYAFIEDFHAHPSLTDATGIIFLTLNEDRTALSYTIVLDSLLGLKENPSDRTEPDDIIGIHLHLHVPDTVGPHVLNIFGLATYNTPSEEDADRVIDYDTRTITGIWDDGDATIDPTTGMPFLPFFPLTSKPLTNWIDQLNSGDLMVAIHTNESGFPTMVIHGHISPVPEPGSWGMLFVSLAGMVTRVRFKGGNRK